MLLRRHDPAPAHQCKSVCPRASHETETEQDPRDGSGARSGAGERAEAGASLRGPWPWAPAVPALSRDPLTSHVAELSWHSSTRGPGCGRHKESKRAPGVRMRFPRVSGTRRKPVVAASTAAWRMAEAWPAGGVQCPTISPGVPCCQLPTEDAAMGLQTAGARLWGLHLMLGCLLDPSEDSVLSACKAAHTSFPTPCRSWRACFWVSVT